MKSKRNKKAPAPRLTTSFKSQPALSKDPKRFRITMVIGVFLAAITFAVYGQTLHYEFVNYDDDTYVYENPTVSAGLTLKGIASAFSHYYSYNWIPLTMLSHMLDCQLYHLDAGEHHLTNVLLHAASAIILFLVLRQITGALWRSAFVASVFAVHPLHVESVAWVAERKDVLSGLFFMLTLWAYARYVRKPALLNYSIIIFLFALGLMSKPMLVTLPFILLLLDYWPLNRFSGSVPAGAQPVWLKNLPVPARLVVEKIPFFALSLACCIVTFFAQGHAVKPLEEFSLPLRAGNAVVSYAIYAIQLFCPVNLAVFYPYPAGGLPLFEVAFALLGLVAISVGTFLWRQKRPYLLVGWLWYLIMLAPVIGLVQAGDQARADHYTYLPQIGICLLVTWLAVEASVRLPNRRWALGLGSAFSLAAFTVIARTQTTYWQDSESLWKHALVCNPNDPVAHNNLGLALAQKGQLDEALGHFQKALEIRPRYDDAENNLGNILSMNGQVDAAIVDYQKALEINPFYAKAENNLGLALVQKGQMDEAIVHFQKAVALDPDYEDAAYNLNLALSEKGKGSPAPSK